MTGKTITQKQAEQQVQANIHAAAAELPATAKLDQQLTNTGLCDDPTDNGSPGRVTASSTYQVHNLDPEQYPNLFGHLRDWWAQHNFRVLDDSHQTSTVRYLWVENNQDGPPDGDAVQRWRWPVPDVEFAVCVAERDTADVILTSFLVKAWDVKAWQVRDLGASRI